MATMSAHQPASAIEVVNRKLTVNSSNANGSVSNANSGARNRPDAVNRSVSTSGGGKRGRSPSPQNGVARKKLGGNSMGGRGLNTTDRSAFKRRILITNISYDAEWNELKEFIKSKVQEECFVRVFTGENGKSRGMAIAEFRTEEIVKPAVNTLNQQEFKGRNLHVREETAESRDEFGNPLKFDQNNNLIRQDNGPAGGAANGIPARGGGQNTLVRNNSNRDSAFGGVNNGLPMGMPGGAVTPRNTFGVSMQLLQDLGIDLPLSRRAYVANLDYKTEEKEIIRVFSLAGKVLEVDILKKDGQSMGQCIIEYSHPVEAVQAVSMFKGALFNGRQLSVRVDSRKVNDRQYQVPFPTLDNMPSTTLSGMGAGLGEHGKPLDYPDQLMDILVGYRPVQHGAVMPHEAVAAAQQAALQQQQQQQLQLQQHQQQHQQQQQQLAQQLAQQQAAAAAMPSMLGAGMMAHSSYMMGGTAPSAMQVQQQQQQPAMNPMTMQTPVGMVLVGAGGTTQPQNSMMLNQPQQMMSTMPGTSSSNMVAQPGGMNMMMQSHSQPTPQGQPQQQLLSNPMQNAMTQQYGANQYGNDGVGGMVTNAGGGALANNMQVMANGMPVGSGGIYSQGGGASQGHATQQQQQSDGGWAAAAMPNAGYGDGSSNAAGGQMQHSNMMGGVDMGGGGMGMMAQPQMSGMHQQQQQPGRQYGGFNNNNRMSGGGGGGGGSQDMNLLVSNAPPGVEWPEVREHFNRITGMKGIRQVEKKSDAEGIFVVKYFDRDAFLRAQQMMDRTSIKGRLIDVTLPPPGYR